MTNEKKTEIWTIDELVSLTENVQSKDIEYNGKTVPVQWCELTEAEEPKLSLPDENFRNFTQDCIDDFRPLSWIYTIGRDEAERSLQRYYFEKSIKAS